MSTQDAVNAGNRKTTARRVKFGATLEDLEGRVLLSAVHHVQLHRAAHVRVVPVHTAKPASHAQAGKPPRTVTPTRMTPAHRSHHKNSAKAIAAAIINVQPTITIQPSINVQPNVSGGTASTQSASNTSANTTPTSVAPTGTSIDGAQFRRYSDLDEHELVAAEWRSQSIRASIERNARQTRRRPRTTDRTPAHPAPDRPRLTGRVRLPQRTEPRTPAARAQAQLQLRARARLRERAERQTRVPRARVRLRVQAASTGTSGSANASGSGSGPGSASTSTSNDSSATGGNSSASSSGSGSAQGSNASSGTSGSANASGSAPDRRRLRLQTILRRMAATRAPARRAQVRLRAQVLLQRRAAARTPAHQARGRPRLQSSNSSTASGGTANASSSGAASASAQNA